MRDNPFNVLWNNRVLLLDLTKREIESKYKGSLLGKSWILFHHLSLILIYTFVFSFIMQIKLNTNQGELSGDFSIWLYCGLLPWLSINEALTSSVHSITTKTNFVKRIVFPLEILPVMNVLVSFSSLIIGFVLLMVGLIVIGNGLSWTILYIPLIFIPMFFFMSGLSLLFAGLGVYMRDLGQIVGLLSTLWLYATPILYTFDMVPVQYQWIFNFNPLTGIVNFYRDVLFWGVSPDFLFIVVFFLIGLLIYLLGFKVFYKIKKGFADVL